MITHSFLFLCLYTEYRISFVDRGMNMGRMIIKPFTKNFQFTQFFSMIFVRFIFSFMFSLVCVCVCVYVECICCCTHSCDGCLKNHYRFQPTEIPMPIRLGRLNIQMQWPVCKFYLSRAIGENIYLFGGRGSREVKKMD